MLTNDVHTFKYQLVYWQYASTKPNPSEQQICYNALFTLLCHGSAAGTSSENMEWSLIYTDFEGAKWNGLEKAAVWKSRLKLKHWIEFKLLEHSSSDWYSLHQWHYDFSVTCYLKCIYEYVRLPHTPPILVQGISQGLLLWFTLAV